MTDRIEVGESSTGFIGPSAVAIFRAMAVASALRLYARTGIKANRAYTPRAMMLTATAITGKKFKARDYMGAADALDQWRKDHPVPVVQR